MSIIQIIGEINEESFAEFFGEFNDCVATDEAATLVLRSEGGTSIDALAYASLIRHGISLGTIVGVTAHGSVESAAVMILAAGSKGHRCMAKEAWVMVHEDHGKVSGSVTEMEREIKHFRRLEDQWATLLEELTGTAASVWKNLHQNETYLSAQECLELGLVDKLI